MNNVLKLHAPMKADTAMTRRDIIEMAYDVLDELAFECNFEQAMRFAWDIRHSVARRYGILLLISVDSKGYIVYN